MTTTSQGFGVTVSMVSFLGRVKDVGQGPGRAESEGKRDVAGAEDPDVAKGKDGPFAPRAKRSLIYAAHPDMATEPSRPVILDSAALRLMSQPRLRSQYGLLE